MLERFEGGEEREREEYQLEKEALRNPMEEMDILNYRVEQIMCNAGTNGFR